MRIHSLLHRHSLFYVRPTDHAGVLPFTVYREDYVERVSILNMSMSVGTDAEADARADLVDDQGAGSGSGSGSSNQSLSSTHDGPSFIGRTYRYLQEEPLWPFGFGLSYTEFEVTVGGHRSSNITVAADALCPFKHNKYAGDQSSPTAPITVSVSNTGSVAGAKVSPVG